MLLLKKNKKWGLALCLPYNQGTHLLFSRRVRPSLLLFIEPFIFHHSLLSLAPNITEGTPGQSRTKRSTNACIQQITIGNKSCNDHGYVRSSRKQLSAIHDMI